MPRAKSPDDSPADDSIEPALMTPRRLAADFERLGRDVAALGVRAHRNRIYVDSKRVQSLSERFRELAEECAEVAGEILLCKIPITAGRDEAAGRERYPLITKAEANGQAKTSEPTGPDAWRSVPIANRPLGPDLPKALATLGIETCGQAWDALEGGYLKRGAGVTGEQAMLLRGALADICGVYLDEVPGPAPEAPAPPQPPSDEAQPKPSGDWRSVPIGRLNLPTAAVFELQEAGIGTCGDAWARLENGTIVDVPKMNWSRAMILQGELHKLRHAYGEPDPYVELVTDQPPEEHANGAAPVPPPKPSTKRAAKRPRAAQPAGKGA